jgi:hypothetical protein
MARKTRLTPGIQQAIVTAIVGGVPYVQAALMVDVPVATANEWRQRGEGRDPERPSTPLYAAFAVAIKKAEAQDEARRILRINQAGQGGTIIYEKTTTYEDGRVTHEVRRTSPEWTADAWHLERKYPDRYGRRLQADLTLQIQKAAQEVADEIGIDVALVLREAQTYLLEARNGSPPSGADPRQ